MASNFVSFQGYASGSPKEVILYTVPENKRGIVKSIQVSNKDTSPYNLTVTWHDLNNVGIGTTSHKICNNLPIQTGIATLELLPNIIVLRSGDKIGVVSDDSSNNKLSVFITAIEQDY